MSAEFDELEPKIDSDGDHREETGGQFKTDWSMIFAAIDDQEPSDAALSRVVQRYWPAIFAYVRATGVNEHDASDITQGFVCDVVLGRRLLEAADPKRGRFRSLLLGSLRNYLNDEHRRRTAKKRQPEGSHIVALEEVGQNGSVPGRTATPERAFCAQWSATLIRRVLDAVRRQCQDDGLGAHWCVFEARVVRPMLFREPPVDYSDLIRRVPLRDQSQAANMMVTVKRRFASALRHEVSLTLDDPAEVGEEIADLLRDLELPK